MITELKISNYKCHRETNLTLKGLTVLTGTNSSGKTSVIQTLLLLRQSYRKGRLANGLDLNNPLCEIGAATDAFCKIPSSSVISFDVKSDDGDDMLFKFETSGKTADSFIPKAKEYPKITKSKMEKLGLFSNNFQYVSAARWGGKSKYPIDSFAAGTEKQISLSHGQGELVANFLYVHGKEKPIICESGVEGQNLMGECMYWENRISAGVMFDIQPDVDGKSYNLTYGYDNGSANMDKLQAENLGYGISYTLPVVAALLSAVPGSLIIIENPEAHLHVTAQSELARLISLVVAKGVQVIVETHSDHIVNGILVNIKQKTIPNENVVFYFFEMDQENFMTTTYRLDADEEGTMSNVPEGFFNQFEKDLDILVG
jgi:predicted ATPase